MAVDPRAIENHLRNMRRERDALWRMNKNGWGSDASLPLRRMGDNIIAMSAALELLLLAEKDRQERGD